MWCILIQSTLACQNGLLSTSDLGTTQGAKKKGIIVSNLVLLNSDGVVARKLSFVSLPADYVIPDGMTVSWRTVVRVSSGDPLASFGPREPVEAYFYLGDAMGEVRRDDFRGYEHGRLGEIRFGSRILTVTVQGTSARDVMKLRDYIMHLISSGAHWEVSNDLNRKPKRRFLRRNKK